MTKIHGADYVPAFQHTARTKHEWQQLMRDALKAGGFRRAESDNAGPVTYIHGRDGKLVAEIHANIPEPTEGRP
jgi:hypothetical protein